MDETIEKLGKATVDELDLFLKAVLQRYGERYLDWEICTLSLQKSEDRNTQLDRLINMINNLRCPSESAPS